MDLQREAKPRQGLKRGESAHLRRLRDLLVWLDEVRDDAQVTWRGKPLGAWHSLRPRWKPARGKIRLGFMVGERNREFWLSAAASTPGGAVLRLSAPGHRTEESLVIVWSEEWNDKIGTIAPGSFPRQMLQWAGLNFPGCRIVSVTRRSDLAHTLSGSFLRIRLRHNGRDILLLAAAAGDPNSPTHSALTQALLWRLHLRRQLTLPPGIHILVPAGCSDVLLHRSQYLALGLERISIKVYAENQDGHLRISDPDLPASPKEDLDFRWPVLGPFRWSSILEEVLNLAPASIRRYPRFQDYDSLRLWGLEFARVTGAKRDHVQFGVSGSQVDLTEESFERLKTLVGQILYYRRPDSPDAHHPYYRVQGERWLESLILDEIPRLFPELLPESVYPQIPVYLGREPGRVDILGADRHGRLVVMELKVTQDPDLPLQALDYWGRVIGHNQNGDFERRGYFSGITLDRRPPRIYLVSPVFSFHDTTEKLLSFVDPAVEVWKVSVNEDWRSGVKIVRRNRLRCGN